MVSHMTFMFQPLEESNIIEPRLCLSSLLKSSANWGSQRLMHRVKETWDILIKLENRLSFSWRKRFHTTTSLVNRQFHFHQPSRKQKFFSLLMTTSKAWPAQEHSKTSMTISPLFRINQSPYTSAPETKLRTSSKWSSQKSKRSIMELGIFHSNHSLIFSLEKRLSTTCFILRDKLQRVTNHCHKLIANLFLFLELKFKHMNCSSGFNHHMLKMLKTMLCHKMTSSYSLRVIEHSRATIRRERPRVLQILVF